MEYRGIRKCTQIFFGIVILILFLITCLIVSDTSRYIKNNHGSENQPWSSGVNVQFVSIFNETIFPDGNNNVMMSCFWNDLYNYDELIKDNNYYWLKPLKYWQFKPPSQTRLPAISTIFQDDEEAAISKEISVFLVSVDMCLPDERQKAIVLPAIPSQYRVFAMMNLPSFPSETPGISINRSLPYAMMLAAQRAGYAGVLFFHPYRQTIIPQCATMRVYNPGEQYLSEQIFISALLGTECGYGVSNIYPDTWHPLTSYIVTNNLNFSPAKILVTKTEKKVKVKDSKTYLIIARLHFLWLPVGPLLTVIWIIKRRLRIPEQPENQDNQFNGSSPTNSNDSVITNITTNNRDLNNENTPLLPLTQTRGVMQESNNGRTARIAVWLVTLRRRFVYLLWLSGCLIFPLPLGFSAGGLSFIRPDENDPESFVALSFAGGIVPKDWMNSVHNKSLWILIAFIVLWSPVQVMFFLIYSKVKCRKTWIVTNDISKLIRCSWFKTSILLLFFGAVTPSCVTVGRFAYFTLGYTIINTLTSASNIIFLLLLNKHSKCTVFVFYASVCMICAYIESNVVSLVIYFMLNSVGSLDNLKTTALRTIDISTALGFSFQTSMHIVHKLRKPQESLFDELSLA